jgi:ABC-type multidrug transport system fused ATPase/permease subunit
VIFGSEVFPSAVLEQIAAETGARYEDTLRDDDLPGEPGDPEHSWMGLMRYDYVTMIEGSAAPPSSSRRSTSATSRPTRRTTRSDEDRVTRTRERQRSVAAAPLIELRGASFGYDGAAVLSHVDYAVTDDEFTGHRGPVGSGKTSLLRLLLGTVKPQHGTVHRQPASPSPTSRSSRR